MTKLTMKTLFDYALGMAIGTAFAVFVIWIVLNMYYWMVIR